MTDIVIMLVIFPIVLFTNCKLFGKEYRENIPTRQDTNFLKGVAALMVVFAHYTTWMEAGIGLPVILIPYKSLGPLGVAIFMFLSGYGLYMSSKWDKLKLSFILKRLKNVYLPYIVIRVLTLAVGGYDFSVGEGIRYIIGFSIKPAWFIVVILLLYIGYFMVSWMKSGKLLFLYLYTIIISTVFLYTMGIDHSNWFANNISFPIGVTFAVYHDKIIEQIKRNYTLYLIITIISFLVCSALYLLFKSDYIFWAKSISGVLLSICCILFLMKFSFESRPMIEIGRLSLYVYLIHSPLFRIVEKTTGLRQPIYVLLFFIGTVFIAYVCSRLVALLDKGLLIFCKFRR